jgi:hypothetical protein
MAAPSANVGKNPFEVRSQAFAREQLGLRELEKREATLAAVRWGPPSFATGGL